MRLRSVSWQNLVVERDFYVESLTDEQFDALSRAERFTYMRLVDDELCGTSSRPTQVEIDAYLKESKTPPEPGPGPFRKLVPVWEANTYPVVVDN